MPVSNVILITFSAMILLIGGPLVGMMITRARLHDRMVELDERERRLRNKRVENSRKYFEDSTVRIHHPESFSQVENDLREALENKSLKLSILQQDTTLEIQRLNEEIQRLKSTSSKKEASPMPADPGLPRTKLPPSVFITPLNRERERNTRSETAPDSGMLKTIPSKKSVSDPPNNPSIKPASADDFQFHWTPAPGENDDTVHSATLPPRIKPAPAPRKAVAEQTESTRPADTNGTGQVLRKVVRPKPSDPKPDQPKDSRLLMSTRPAPPPPRQRAATPPPAETPQGNLTAPASTDSASISPRHAVVEPRYTPKREMRPATPTRRKKSPQLPVFKPVSEWVGASSTEGNPNAGIEDVSDMEQATVRRIVQLPHDEFGLLAELGYASLRKLSTLSPGEIRRLTELFGVPQEHIGGRWVPEARARLAELEAEPHQRHVTTGWPSNS